MIAYHEIYRIAKGALSDALILGVTFLGTLFLHIDFAVLSGILLSFAVYILRTSVPKVHSLVPDAEFKHFVRQTEQPSCPQLGIVEIRGDLYFGAVTHVEEAVARHLSQNAEQRFLLLRMQSVNQCDFSGIHALESIVRTCRDRGGSVFITGVQEPVLELMESTGFCHHLGSDHISSEVTAIDHLFHKVLDPAICIYECPVRVFKECQNLPKQQFAGVMPLYTEIPTDSVVEISARELWDQMHDPSPPLVVDVREPREFELGHIPKARLLPFPILLSSVAELPTDRTVVLVCRGGRRSTRAAHVLGDQGYDRVLVLEGGMLAWQSAGLLEAFQVNKGEKG